MDQNILELLTNFNKIKGMGYVKTLRKGNTGLGYTFEYLLGKKEDNACLPNFKGIEVKTKLGNSTKDLSLFSLVPYRVNTTSALYFLLKNFGYVKEGK